ncbi:MAG: protein kinase, partial [Acidobacteriota bacterium]
MKCPTCNFDNPDDTYYCGKCGTQLPPSEEIPLARTKTLQTPKIELTPGSTFAGRYQIIEELGRGGMGKVYKIFDKKIKEKVALKLIKPEIAADEDTIERFSNELKFARKISHRNVCRMYDLSEEEGTHYITMEYVPGEDLKSTIRRVGQLSVGKAISIAKQVCEGLAEAHRLGVVHRDLKPQNIIIDREGNARIMDFGIARSLEAKGITDAGVMIGTPEYMSPEQVEGNEIDGRSDIYSLGVILYEMVTGRVPFAGNTPLSIAMKHKTEAPPYPGVVNAQIPEDLSRLILRCMEKDKGRRYQKAEEILSELSKIERGVPTTERILPERKPETEKVGKIKWRNYLLYGGAAVLLILLIVGGIYLFTGRREAIDSIAVLPLENLSGDPEQEYFADGMTEALISELAKIRALRRVISRTSVMQYKGVKKPLQDIARDLNVDAVVEGSVLLVGERVRITAQLIDARMDRHLWAERYERDLRDVLTLQSELAQAIAREIKVAVTPEEKARLTRTRPIDPEAYEA